MNVSDNGVAQVNPLVPRIIHLMFFPWGKDQKLVDNQLDFDHGPYERMVRYAEGFEVKLWDYPSTERLCLEFYPDIWRVASSLPRPMMLVNTLRWLMVYHHGGISWQYDMNPLVPMDRMMPSADREVRLFTEVELTPEKCLIRTSEPIRGGEPEEPVRIPSQVFSAVPRHRYMKAVVDFIHERSKTYTFKRDYDCQYISGNAAASTAYDLFGKNDPTVERIGPVETRQMMKIIYQGSWRTEDLPNCQQAPRTTAGETMSAYGVNRPNALLRQGWNVVKATHFVANWAHCYIKPHIHEEVFGALRESNPEVSRVGEGLLDGIEGVLRHCGFKSVLIYPAFHLRELAARLGDGVDCIAGDMVRDCRSSRFMNLMYSRIPRVDVVVLRGLFDLLSLEDAVCIVDRVKSAGIRFLLSTHYPCLNKNWDTYSGEWRPVNLTMPPFGLAEPERWVNDPDPDRRPDRGLGLFEISGFEPHVVLPKPC